MPTFNQTIIKRFLTDEFACLPEAHRGALLDLGCGTRPYARLYKGRFRHSLSADFDVRTTIDVRVDAKHLPFAAASFDVILLSEVIEHIPDPGKALREISRVLRPGGVLLVTWPFIYMLHEIPRDYLRITEFGMAELLEGTSLRIEFIMRRGNVLAVSIVILEFLTMGALEAAARMPFLGRVFALLKAFSSRFIFGGLFKMYVALTWRSSCQQSASVGAGLKGVSGYMSHWTLGYCARLRKIPQ